MAVRAFVVEIGFRFRNGVTAFSNQPFASGRSVSHLDEATYANLGSNSIMTPNLDAGEIFREPGTLLLAMMEDLRRKPPVGVAIGVPQVVRNAAAIIADICSGMGKTRPVEIPNRREAIAYAVNIAQGADVVIVAGKGHETVQIVGATSLPFSDVEELELSVARNKAATP
jgi:hypothetical protein